MSEDRERAISATARSLSAATSWIVATWVARRWGWVPALLVSAYYLGTVAVHLWAALSAPRKAEP